MALPSAGLPQSGLALCAGAGGLELGLHIARFAGIQAALSLAQKYGGQRIYIPAAPPDDHELVRLLGRAAADTLADYYGPGSLDMPRGPKAGNGSLAAESQRLTAEGLSANQIAARLHLTRRTVFNHRRAAAAGRIAPLDLLKRSRG